MTVHSASQTDISQRQFVVNRFLWIFIAVIALVDAIWLWRAGIGMDAKFWWFTLPVLLACLMLGAFYRTVRKDDRLFLFSQAGAQIISGTIALAVFSYVTAGLGFPMVDEQLIAADKVFFFDWKQWVLWIDRSPALVTLLTLAYDSSAVQMLVILPLLFFYRHIDHVQRYLIVFLFSAFVVIVISTLIPAVAGYAFYQLESKDFHSIDTQMALQHVSDLMAMRNHTLEVMPSDLKGIVTFPSFHAVIAVLLIYACWPLPKLLVITLPINLMMLVSTLSNGGHYLVDVISGVIIALSGIVFAKRVLPAS